MAGTRLIYMLICMALGVATLIAASETANAALAAYAII